MGHNPTEHIQEHVTHEAAHGGHGDHGSASNKWITAAALTAAFLAAFAAVSSSLATKHLTESTLKRIEANDNWNFYQSKSIKSSLIDGRFMEYNLADSAKIPPAVAKQHDDDLKKKAEYATKIENDDLETPQGMAGIQGKAKGLEDESRAELTTHETYEMSATMFHIAIAVVAIAVVAKRKEFWYMSMVGGAVGIYFFGNAYVHAPAHHGAEHAASAEHTTAAPHTPAAPGSGEHTPAAEHKSTEEHAPSTPPAEPH